MKTLKAELVVARNNISVMSDMMSQMEPGSLEPTDTELLQVGIRHGHKPTHTFTFSCMYTLILQSINVKGCCCFSTLSGGQ